MVISKKEKFKETKLRKSDIIKRDIQRNKSLYLIFIPIIAYYIIFSYVPMSGVLVAFQDFKMKLGNSYFENILSSDFVGFKHFKDFFSSFYFGRVMFNTVKISILSVVIGFPFPIIFALLLNEVRNDKVKRIVQTVTYMPHFISIIVICGLIKSFVSDTGFISVMLSAITGNAPENLLNKKEYFVPIYIISEIWQTFGWNSIVYIAALAGVDAQLYEAAMIDGAGRFKQVIHVTLPSIVPTIVIMLILRMGGLLGVGLDKVLLLYNSLTKPVADVISTYVYERGLIERDFSFSTAVGMFQSVVNIFFVVVTNTISRKVSETSLW